MKFPRHSRLLRGPFDLAPFAAVLFLLVIFLGLAGLLPVPGLRMTLNPPAGSDLPGVAPPTVAVAMDAAGRLFFANQLVTEDKLKPALQQAARKSTSSLTLVIHADKSVTYDQLVHLVLLARQAGITNALLATLPRAVPAAP